MGGGYGSEWENQEVEGHQDKLRLHDPKGSFMCSGGGGAGGIYWQAGFRTLFKEHSSKKLLLPVPSHLETPECINLESAITPSPLPTDLC